MSCRASRILLYHSARRHSGAPPARRPGAHPALLYYGRRALMPQRGQQTTLQERVQIRDLTAAGYADPEIAAVLTRPIATVRKWRRIAQHQTRPDLASHFGCKTIGALSTFPADLQA